MAIAALICGIVSLLGCFNPFYLVSITAIVLGIIALNRQNESKGMALAGLITGGLAMIIWPAIEIVFSLFTGGLGLLTMCI